MPGSVASNSQVIGMPATLLDFDAVRLAEAVDQLPAEQMKALPFEAIHLDASGAITRHGGTVKQQQNSRNTASKRGGISGTAPSVNVQAYRGCIDRALAQNKPDLEFSHVFGLSAGTQDVEVRVRVQPARDGGRWVFLQRQD